MVSESSLKQKALLLMQKSRILHLVLATIALMLFFIACSQTKKAARNSLEFYITPRNVNYGWGDEGVYKFSLNKVSIKVPYSNRTYTSSIRKDSLYELYYHQELGGKKMFKNIETSFLNLSESKFSTPRIIIVINYNNNVTDTVLVDYNYKLKRDQKVFEADSAFKKYLISMMPEELKESWMYNKMRR